MNRVFVLPDHPAVIEAENWAIENVVPEFAKRLDLRIPCISALDLRVTGVAQLLKCIERLPEVVGIDQQLDPNVVRPAFHTSLSDVGCIRAQAVV